MNKNKNSIKKPKLTTHLEIDEKNGIYCTTGSLGHGLPIAAGMAFANKIQKKSGKIYVSNSEKILETFLSIFDLIKLSFSYKKDDQIQHDHNLINEEINLNERI